MVLRVSPEITIFGIVVTIRLAWMVALGIAFGLTASQLAPDRPFDGYTILWYFNTVVVACVAVGSLVVHESAHALMGRRLGRNGGRISLYPFGGVPDDFDDPGTPQHDVLISLAGPLASALLAGLLFSLWGVTSRGSALLERDLLFLAGLNLALAVINLLPGYPLDGGRIFRALVWYLHDSFTFGTRIAVAYGQVIGTFAVALGLIMLGSRTNWSTAGIWIIIIGWCITRVGRQEMVRSLLIAVGSTLTAGDAVRGLNPHVRAGDALDEVLETLLAELRSGPALVTDEQTVIGIISLNDVRHYRRSQWSSTTARDAMTPISAFPVLDESTSIRKLLRKFETDRTSTLIVSGSDGVIGVLDRRIAIERLIHRVRDTQRPSQ